MRLLRRLIILSHRYLGIAISLMCVVWFASGIVMIYAGGHASHLCSRSRLERRALVDLLAHHDLPPQASQRLGIHGSRGSRELAER